MSIVQKSIRLFAWRSNYVVLKIIQGESSSRVFDIELFDGLSPVNLTDCTVLFYSEKPDSTIVYVECSVISAHEGKIQVLLDEQMTTVDGNASCWIQVVGKNREDLRFDGLTLKISECGIESTLRSADAFVALENALAQAQELVEYLETVKQDATNSKQIYDELVADVQELMPSLSTALESANTALDELKEELEKIEESEIYVKKSSVNDSVVQDSDDPVSGAAVASYVEQELDEFTDAEIFVKKSSVNGSVVQDSGDPVSGAAVAAYVAEQIALIADYDGEVF